MSVSAGVYRDDAALADEADDRVVGARAAGGRVDDDEDVLVLGELERGRAEHGVDVDLAEDLLEAVEREARELGLDEVRAVLRAKKKTYDTDVSSTLHQATMNEVELQRENEALKLKLFWEKHSPKELNAAMRLANLGSSREGGVDCSCLSCIRSRRVDFAYNHYHHWQYDVPCKFKSCFEYMIRENDMSIGNNVLDDGHHFINSANQDWVGWTYGSKLLKATSVGDPELAKLEGLFEDLGMIGY